MKKLFKLILILIILNFFITPVFGADLYYGRRAFKVDDNKTVTFIQNDPNYEFMIFEGVSGQNENFVEFKDSGGSVKTYVDPNGMIHANDILLDYTTNTNKFGIIYKDANTFIHDFAYGNNGAVTIEGQNVFVGESAGNLTMGSTGTETYHGSRNVGVGFNALIALTTGNRNVAIGHQAADSLTEGYRNIAIGSNALGLATTSYETTSVGMNSLRACTTGYKNAAFGWGALDDLTEGYFNIAVGYQSLGGITTGYNNTAFGYDAGRFITGGSTPNTTGNQSLFLGDNTRANADGETCQIVIGSGVTGLGANTGVIGMDCMTKMELRVGNLGLNESTPDTLFDMIGTAPYFQIHNSTEEDGDGGRECIIQARGEQSGGEESLLGLLEFSHDGAADDQKGIFKIKINDGNDDLVPTTVFTIDSDLATNIGDGGTTNYASFAADGELTLHGTARVTRHINIGAASWHLGVSAPDTSFVGIGYTLLFDKTTDEHVHYVCIVPSDMEVGSEVEIVVCWSFDTEEAGHYVTWEMVYLSVASTEDPAGAGTTIYQTTAVTTADGDVSEDKMICTTFSTTMQGLVSGETLFLKFGRDADETGGTDDLNQDARVHSVHLHYIKDKLGAAT